MSEARRENKSNNFDAVSSCDGIRLCFFFCLALPYCSLLFKCLVWMSLRSWITGGNTPMACYTICTLEFVTHDIIFHSCGTSSVLKFHCRCLELELKECCYFHCLENKNAPLIIFCLWLPLLQRVFSSMKAFEIFTAKETWDLVCIR